MPKYFLFVINLVVCTALSLQTSFSEEKNSLFINEWLISDGIKIHNPVFADSLNNKGEKFSTKAVLDFNHTEINELYPQSSSKVEWSNSNWTAFSSDDKNPIELDSRDSEIFYAVTYIQNDRWIKGTLKINANSPYAVFLDKDKLGNNELKDDVASSENSLELLKGKHRILLKFYVSDEIAPEFKAVFEYDEKFGESSITNSINPIRGMEIHDVLDAKKINNIELSFDASYVLMNVNNSCYFVSVLICYQNLF